jgi:hypothetical protein
MLPPPLTFVEVTVLTAIQPDFTLLLILEHACVLTYILSRSSPISHARWNCWGFHIDYINFIRTNCIFYFQISTKKNHINDLDAVRSITFETYKWCIEAV